jgi:PAS domain S-box-containing protein
VTFTILGSVHQHELAESARNLNAQLRMEIKVRESITQELAEQARELAEKARLLDLSHDAIIVRDMEGHIRYWNRGAEELYGWSRDEVMGKVSHILLQTEFPIPLAEMTKELHRTDRWIGELIHVARDGTRLTVLARKTLDRDSQGNPAAVLENISDITARKQAEERLRESEERYRSLFSLIDEGFCIIEKIEGEAGGPLDFRYVEVNPAFTVQSGVHGMIGKTIRQILRDEAEEWCLIYDAVLRTGEPTRFERGILATERVLELYAFRVEDKSQRRVAVIFKDISERKRAQEVIRRFNAELETRVEHRTEELRTANEELRHQIALRLQMEQEILEISEREKQRIGQDLHDDLGQQLAGSWMLSVALAQNLANQRSPEVSPATRISDLLEKALATTRGLARGLHPVAPEQGGLISALHQLAARMSDTFLIDCRFECAVSTYAGDDTTATHLYRIAQEAVTNAVKHGSAGQVRISLSFGLEGTTLTVKDDGSGIAPLDPKAQGMGLRIMHYRADMIGATISIEKQKSGGTCVTCALPVPKQAPPLKKLKARRNPRARPRMG